MKFYLYIYLSISGCKRDENVIIENYLRGKTYFQLTPKDSGHILFEYCDSNIPKLRFGKTLYIDYGQEQSDFKKWGVKQYFKDSVKIYYYYEGKEAPNTIDIKIDTLRNIIYRKNVMFIDSMKTLDISYVKQPCTDCWEKEDCDEMKKNGEW